MDSNIRSSLIENGLGECCALMEQANICTLENIRNLKITRLCNILVDDDDLIEKFNNWRGKYKEPRAPLFFERLNCATSLHHLSVVVRVDTDEWNKPVISSVKTVFMEHLMAASTEYVPMISLVGGTGSGKSFLASSFMVEGSDPSRWPTVAEDSQTVPTTSHVCAYKGQMRVGSKRPVNLMDLEGESGDTPKTLTRDFAGMAQAAAESIVATVAGAAHLSQYAASPIRGSIIKHTMPRMAYLLSDVILFVDTIELRREEFIDRVKSFALEAHQSCNTVGWRPALIIVSNKWSPATADPAGVDQTSAYKDIVTDLLLLFSRVAIMRIPGVLAFRTKPEFVAECIDQLHAKIDDFIGHVQQLREHRRCLYAEKKSWYLFREVVKWVNSDPYGDKPIKSLAKLYDNAMQKSSTQNALRALHMYCDYEDSAEQYSENLTNVLRWYAYLAACDRKLGVQGEVDPADVCRAVLERCYAVEQCTATYTAPDGTVYHCRQHCQGHEDFHSNPALLRVPTQNLLWRFFKFKDAIPVRWAGEFQSAQMRKKQTVFFLEQVASFAAMSGEALLTSFNGFQPAKMVESAFGMDVCGLCLNSFNDNATILANCRHLLCEDCVVKRTQLYPTATNPPVCVCPFCCVESPCPIYEPEEHVGFRVLSLDGGGVKGLIEVKVLQKIEAFFHPLKIANLFDVIVGTSAGGIIAMLLKQDKPLEKIVIFLEFMAKSVLDVSSDRRESLFFENQFSCSTDLFESALQFQLGKGSHLAVNSQLHPPHYFCTAFDVEVQNTVLLGSLRVLNHEVAPHDPLLAQIGRVHSARLWEAARATSAAPAYFAPQYLHNPGGSSHILIDGGVGEANCPAHLAMRLAILLQRKSHGYAGKLDMCLSLGAGTNSPDLERHAENGLTWAANFVDVADDSERIWKEKCMESPEFASVKDRIRINPPNLGSLNAFASASIPLIHSGMDDFFASPDAVRQMDILFHTMYAKLWKVSVGGNPVIPAPFSFTVSLRDLRLKLDDSSDDELRRIISDRGGETPPEEASRDELVGAARYAHARKPVVADLAGHFGCTFNGVEYESNNGAFEIPTADLLPGVFGVDVYWQQTEAGHRISVSGFPTHWSVLSGSHK